MFRVKICGVKNVEDAITAVEAGADAIGLNFYAKSPRYLESEAAGQILRATISSSIHRVGVFVNMDPMWIEEHASRNVLGAVQLHGDEPPETVVYFSKSRGSQPHPIASTRPELYRRSVIRARRMDERGVSKIAEDLVACANAGALPSAVLVDAMTPGRYGGTGETVSWVGLADHKRWLGNTPLILAGGLTPDNVAEAIRIVRPAAVDVASGVESAPGKKDPVKVRDFVANALGAFEALRAT